MHGVDDLLDYLAAAEPSAGREQSEHHERQEGGNDCAGDGDQS